MKKINNDIEYNAIVTRIDELVEIVNDDTPQTDRNYIELDLLADMVVEYEKIHFPVSKPELVDVLKLRMYEMRLNQTSMAKLLGVSNSRINDYLNGRSEPTLKVAREMNKKLNIDANVILGV